MLVIFRNELIETAFYEYKRKMKGIRLAEGKSVSGKGRLADLKLYWAVYQKQ